MQRIVRGVHVQNHLLRGLRDALPRRPRSAARPSPPGRPRSSCTLPSGPSNGVRSSRFRVLLPASGLPRSDSTRRNSPVRSSRSHNSAKQPVPAQLVVVVEVLVAQAQPQAPAAWSTPRRNVRSDPRSRWSVKHSLSRPRIRVRCSTSRKSTPPASEVISPPSNRAHDIPSVQALKSELCSGTLCVHKVAFLLLCKLLISQHL